MTTRTELLEIIANGENSKVEFKRDDIQNHALAKELVAFSNMEGGMVLLGVEDDGSVSGLTRPDIEEWVMTACRDKIRPAIIPSFRIVGDAEAGGRVAVVQVPRGMDVHSRWHNNRNAYYIRVGTQSREPTPEELGRLFQQREEIRAEMRPVPGTTLDHLDRRRLKDYYGRVREQELPHDGDEPGWRTLLVNTEILVEDGVTWGGMLLFGTTPNRFLPQAGIDAVAFPGTEKDYATRERTALRGPMTPLMDARGGVLETGLVEQAVEFVRRNTHVTASLEDGARRVEKPTYPVEAVREAVVNALIHRDYLFTGTDVELAVYDDRLEVISPGGLPNGVTVERMRTGVRSARNMLLNNVMSNYGYLEHMGMGVPRKIVRGMKEHNRTDPDLVVDGERFVVRLFARARRG